MLPIGGAADEEEGLPELLLGSASHVALLEQLELQHYLGISLGLLVRIPGLGVLKKVSGEY